MPEPLKEFEVLHPRPPVDEPLTESYQTPILGLWKERYTATGKLWITFPWMFIIEKKLSCSLMELLIIVFSLGSSAGSVISALIKNNAAPEMIVIIALVFVQGYLWLISAALYNQRLRPKNADSVPNGAYMALYLLFPTVTCNGMGLVLFLK